MKNLKKSELDIIYKDDKNLTDKSIFIDFYADWWGPCKMFEQVLNKVTPEYEDKVHIYKVNIENEPEIANQFGVRSIPQISMIRKDSSKEQSVGGMNEDQLKYWLGGLI